MAALLSNRVALLSNQAVVTVIEARRGVEMRVAIDDELCQGHGRCALLCPEVFDLDDDGHGVVVVESIPDDVEPEVRQAISDCPEQAISESRDGQ